MIKSLVSVIIPTTQREIVQAWECKESVLASTYPAIEVIIVCEGLERSAQRNIGLRKAKGEFILYLDSDQRVSRYLIEECAQLMGWGYDAVYIPEVITTEGWFARLRNYERQFYDGTAVDCVRFIRASKCPEFSEALNGPEDSLHDRQVQGRKVISQSVIYHNDNVGLFRYFAKKAYYSKSMRSFAELSPKDKCLNPFYRCFWIFVENGKWKRILRNPVAFLGVMILIFVRGIIYLTKK